MNPHEQTWHANAMNGRIEMDPASGRALMILAPPAEHSAVVNLVTAAPKMARELLGMLDEDGHIQACGNGGEDPENCSPACFRIRNVLYEAGVLE